MGFNTVGDTSYSGIDNRIVNQIHVDGTNVKVMPAGTPPSVVYRIGDGTIHPEGWDNIDGEEYLDFYVSTGAQGTKGDTGEDGLSAYEQAVQGGYSGTQEEFYTLLQEVTDNAVLADVSATAAALSESNAANSAIGSAASATNSAASALSSANSATESSGYATASASSATASSNSASSASASASAASNSATNALGSANAAATSETNAALSELASATSETNAASSAAIALASKEFVDTSLTTVQPNGNTAQENINIVATDIVDVNTIASNMTDVTYFADVYQGAKAVVPTLRNDGSALVAGDLYFNTISNAMFVYNGSAWSETGSAVNGVEKSEEFIATGGQTLFTLAEGYDVGFVNVFREGMLLGESEYTADNGSTVTLDVACIAGDIVKVQAFGAFTLADHYTKAEQDAIDSAQDLATTNSLALKASLTGATFTGQVKGITPIDDEDLARKDYVDSSTIAIASTAETQVGTDNTKAITPLRLHEAMLGGVNQSWTILTGSRATGVTYTNSTGRPISVYVKTFGTASGQISTAFVWAIEVNYSTTNTATWSQVLRFIVPNGATYKITGNPVSYWSELR